MNNGTSPSGVPKLLVCCLFLLAVSRSLFVDARSDEAPTQWGTNPQYHVVHRMDMAKCRADNFAVDSVSRRLYGVCNKVIDLDDYSIVGELPHDAGNAFVLVPQLGRGLTRHGVIFDLKSLKVLAKVAARGDEMAFDSATGRAFLFGPSTAVVDIEKAAVIGHVDLGAGADPEAGVADGQGTVYVNLGNQDQMIIIDARTLQVETRWPLAGCKGPGALSLDERHRRLFVSCERQIMVVDADNGKIVAAVPTIGRQADQSSFDPALQLLLSPSESGKVTVIREDAPDRYSIAQIIDVGQSHDNLAIDPRSHRAFLYNSGVSFTLIALAPGDSVRNVNQ